MSKEYTITISWEQLRLIRRLLKDYALEARADIRACEELNIYHCLKLHKSRLDFTQRLLGRLPSL